MSSLTEQLSQFFGFDTFRPGQQEVIEASVAGKDVLALFPTGAGKSLCFQLAGLVRGGVTVVISPLIALMKDQVANLQRRGIAAEYLSSHLSPSEKRRVRNKLALHEVRFLYLSPERLSDAKLTHLIAGQINFVVIDEAHCISAWGHNFRPPYRKIGEWVAGLPRRPPVAAFTATATAPVVQEIIEVAGLRHPVRANSSFFRPNLRYVVAPLCPQLTQLERVHHWIRGHPSQAGIIYAGTREAVVQWSWYLSQYYTGVAAYHAGIPAKRRLNLQEQFIENRLQILVATSAFGMGVDKPDVRWVLHTGLSADLESYIQEAGRGGRDGEVADCGVALHGGQWESFLEQLDQQWPHPELVFRVAEYIQHACRGRPMAKSLLTAQLAENLETKPLEYLFRRLAAWGWIERQGNWVRWQSSTPKQPFTTYQQRYQQRYAQSLALEKMLLEPSCFTRHYLSYFGQTGGDVLCQNCSFCQPTLLSRFGDGTILPQAKLLLPRLPLSLL